MIDFYIILTSILVAASCSILGCFLILRNMAMVGDAISHAVLPGIVIAFLLTGELDSWYMLLGAAATGLLTTYLIELFSKKGGLQKDATIGIVFTTLFAIGIVLVKTYANYVDIDDKCVLYGEISSVSIEYVTAQASLGEAWYTFDGMGIPSTVGRLSILLFAIMALLIIGYKGLYLTTFDPAYAAALGINVAAWHYVLMSAVSISTVVSFESVGAILVVAYLITPAATAYLLTDQFKKMIALSLVFGIIGSVIGYYVAAWIDGAIAAAIATILGIQFILAFTFVRIKANLAAKKLVS